MVPAFPIAFSATAMSQPQFQSALVDLQNLWLKHLWKASGLPGTGRAERPRNKHPQQSFAAVGIAAGIGFLYAMIR
jgi:hypothetical protein